MYKCLVEAGLYEKLKVETPKAIKSKPNSRISKRSKKFLYSPVSTMTDLSQMRVESMSSCHTKFNS